MRPIIAVSLLLAAFGCGRPRPASVTPQSPNAALADFMAAVKAKNITRMGNLFGTVRGPAAGRANPEYLKRQLQTIQKYWDHVGYRIIEGPLPAAPLNAEFKDVPSQDRMRDYRVELQRPSGCAQVGLMTMVQTDQGGWLVYDAHLESVGNPAARCAPPGTPP